MYREENLTIDLKVKEYNPLRLKQMDTTKLNIELIDSGLEIDLTNLDVDIVFTKPNDTIVMQSSNITKVNNIITVILLEDCLRLPGLANMEVELRNDTQVVSSFFIPITIEKTSKNNIESDNTPNYIEEMENKVKSIEQRGNELIEEIQKNYQDIVDEDLRKEIMDARKNYDTLGQRLDESLSKDYKDTNITAPTVAGWGRIKKLYGRTVEEGAGEKSPDNPYTLKSVGDDVNLFTSTINQTTNGVTAKCLNGTVEAYGKATAQGWITLQTLTLPAGKYYLKGFGSSGAGTTSTFSVKKNGSQIASGVNTSFVLTETSTILIQFYFNANFNGTNIYMPKLVKDIDFTSWSPYGYGTVENISTDGTNSSSNVAYIDKTLCSVGDVRDEIDYTNKKITRRCSSYVLDGSVNPYYIEKYDEYTRFDFDFTGRINPILSTSKLISDKMKISSVGGLGNTTEYIGFSNSNSYKIYLYVKNTRLATIDNAGIGSYLEGNPIKIIYATNPYEKDIECSDKIVQYADSTTVHNRDGAEIEVSLNNSEAISDINENFKNIEETKSNLKTIDIDVTTPSDNNWLKIIDTSAYGIDVKKIKNISIRIETTYAYFLDQMYSRYYISGTGIYIAILLDDYLNKPAKITIFYED